MIYSLKIITGYSRSTGRGRLAQMDRALASEAIGREFESLIAHQLFQIPRNIFNLKSSYQ
jgi:hypothetical protein